MQCQEGGPGQGVSRVARCPLLLLVTVPARPPPGPTGCSGSDQPRVPSPLAQPPPSA